MFRYASTLLVFVFMAAVALVHGHFNNSNSFLHHGLFPFTAPTLRFSFTELDTPVEIKPHLIWRRQGLGKYKNPESIFGSLLATSGFKVQKGTNWLAASSWLKIHGDEMLPLSPYQKMIRAPNFHELDNKARMWSNLKQAMAKFGKKEFAFVPETYAWPEDREQVATMLKNLAKADDGEIWLAKEGASYIMRGISVVTTVDELPKVSKKGLVIQKYIKNAFTINSRKMQLRLNVVTAGFNPLRIYVFNDFLTALGPENLSSSSKHKCNVLPFYPVFNPDECMKILQKSSHEFGVETWNNDKFFGYMSGLGFDTKRLQQQLNDAIVKTVLATLGPPTKRLENRYNSFNFWSVEFLLTRRTARPIMLEFNAYPNLTPSSSGDLQFDINRRTVEAMLNTVAFHLPPSVLEDADAKSSLTSYLANHAFNVSSKQLAFNPKMYAFKRSKEAKAKLREFRTSNREDVGDILEDLSSDDVRVLMLLEDELARAESNGFTRLYPLALAHNAELYVKLSQHHKYYDKLAFAWALKYGRQEDRSNGRDVLRALAQKGIHLQP